MFGRPLCTALYLESPSRTKEKQTKPFHKYELNELVLWKMERGKLDGRKIIKLLDNRRVLEKKMAI